MSEEYDTLAQLSYPIEASPGMLEEIREVFTPDEGDDNDVAKVEAEAVETLTEAFDIESSPDDRTPIRKVLFTPARGTPTTPIAREDIELKDGDEYTVTSPQGSRTLTRTSAPSRGFSFTIYQDSPATLSGARRVVTEESKSLDACMRLQLTITQTFTSKTGERISSKKISSIATCKPHVPTDTIVSKYTPSSLENLEGDTLGKEAIGYVLFPSYVFEASRRKKFVAVRQAIQKTVKENIVTPNTKLAFPRDRTFIFIMPVDSDRVPGFLYLSFDLKDRNQMRYNPNPFGQLFVVGISVAHLVAFITTKRFTQTFTIRIGPNRIPIRINLQGKIIKGIERNVDISSFTKAMRDETIPYIASEKFSKNLVLAITKCVVQFPLGWQDDILRKRLPQPTFNNQMMCNACGSNRAKLMKCNRCKDVFYCGRQCQIKDWVVHKITCRED